MSCDCNNKIKPKLCPHSSGSDSDVSRVTGQEAISQNTRPSNSLTQIDSTSKLPETTQPECFFIDPSVANGNRQESIFRLATNASDLQKRIEEIQEEKNRIEEEIHSKRLRIFEAVVKVSELEKTVQAMELTMADKLEKFQSRLISLESKLMENFKASGDDAVKNTLEDEINEIRKKFQDQTKSDESAKNQIVQNAQVFAATLGENVLKEYLDYNGTAGEVTAKLFNNLIKRPAQFCRDATGARFYYNNAKEKIYNLENYSSEYKINADGVREKLKDGVKLHLDETSEFFFDSFKRKFYTKFYFEDHFGRYFIDIHGNRHYKTDPEASEYDLVNGQWVKIKEGTYEKDEKGLRKWPEKEEENEEILSADGLDATVTSFRQRLKSVKDEDIEYIKEAVGVVLRKALAAVAVQRPNDPINYFVNFLHHYRYNQQMFEKRDKELKYFVELRENMKLTSNNDE